MSAQLEIKSQKKQKRGSLNFLNFSKKRMPRKFFFLWIEHVIKEMSEYRVKNLKSLREKDLSLIFLNKKAMTLLNLSFKKKKKATDVLSFSGPQPDFFGEIVLCPEVILEKRSKVFKSMNEQYAYLILHAILHLMGFSHEGGKKETQMMFSLQDKIFFEGIERFKKNFKKNEKIRERKK